MEHISVLLKETIDGLNIKPDGIYVDATLGRGGHSKEVLKKLTTGKLIAFDKDIQAIEESKENLHDYLDKVTFINRDFSEMKEALNELDITSVDGVMMDLGVSSPQFDDANRGFSYRYDAKLDMRMNQRQALTAYKVVNEYPYSDLVRILFQYGEEKFAKQIARSIERNREVKPIETTFELVDVIKQALPQKVLNAKGHPAKKTFQALRLEVNGELDALKAGIKDATDLLKVNGRCCIITFHSLEDRIVKDYYKTISAAPFVDKRIPILPSQMEQASFVVINKKPIIAGEEELLNNMRAHSAKLRIIERTRD